jgi:hypothetical protein
MIHHAWRATKISQDYHDKMQSLLLIDSIICIITAGGAGWSRHYDDNDAVDTAVIELVV